MNLSRHQLPMPLHNVRSAPWNLLPITVESIAQDVQYLLESISQIFPLFPTFNVIISSTPSTQIQQFFDNVVHHAQQSQKSQLLPAHIIPAACIRCHPPNDSSQPLDFHFSSAFHSTYLATRPHNTLADASRASELRLTVFEACRTSNILHLCQQSRRHVSVDSCQSENS